MDRFTDVAMVKGDDGIFDFDIDKATKDFKLTSGMDSALLISFFTERRARPDEVFQPHERRGWVW